MRPLDRLLLVACGALILAGPLMAIQEFVHLQQAVAGMAAGDGAATMAANTGFRDVWRVVLVVLVLAVGLLGTLQTLRVARAPRVRPLAGRLLALLVAGMILLDLAFLLDRVAADAGHALRAVSVVWAYPFAAVVVALSASRLAELQEAFGDAPGGTPP